MTAAGVPAHQLHRGGAAADLTAAALMRAGSRWPQRLVSALVTHQRSHAGQRFDLSVAALEPALPPDAQLLTSWIIAAA